MSQELTIITAYMVVAIFLLAALSLLAMISHLTYTALMKKKQFAQHKQVLLMIGFTLAAIVAFFSSTTLIITIVIQVILLDAHQIDPGRSALDEFYYGSLDSLHYSVTMLDQLGHLAMLTVFILRLQMCFANSIFGYSPTLIRFLYGCLVLLVAVSFAIILEIAYGQDTQTIIISQVIWEVLVEIMCVWLLYLFVSKLHHLVKMALGSSRTNLRMTITYNLEEKSKTSPTNLRIAAAASTTTAATSPRRQSRHSRQPSGGRPSLKTGHSEEKSNFRSPSPSPSPVPGSTNSQMPPTNPNAQTVPSQSRVSVDNGQPRDSRRVNQTVLNNQNLINVMTKMTLLVVIAVLGSLLTVIANMYWQIHAMQIHLEEGTADTQQMWGYVAPIADMCLASAMLYLQFDFTKGVYARLCNKMDILLLQICGDLLDQNVQDQQNVKRASQIAVASQTGTVLSVGNQNVRGRARTSTESANLKLAIDVQRAPSAEYDGVFKPPSPSPSALAERSRNGSAGAFRVDSFRDRPRLEVNRSGSGSRVKGKNDSLRLEFTRSISAKSNRSDRSDQQTPPITPRSVRSDRSTGRVSPVSPMRNDQVMGVVGRHVKGPSKSEVERAVQRAQPEGQKRKGYVRPGVNGAAGRRGKGRPLPKTPPSRNETEDTEKLKGEGGGNVSRLRAMWE